MSTAHSSPATEQVVYPDCDGEPIAENTLQFDWIVTIKGGLDSLFKDDPNVFVAGDLLWYPVEGDNKTRTAPDAMVVFGRPKGHRGSYKQWEEDGVAPQVVFEVLSPGNRSGELANKLAFYEDYGVEEYYQYDPDREPRPGSRSPLRGWNRLDDRLIEVPRMRGFTSPRLGIRFELGDEKDSLRIYHPDGRLFIGFVEQVEQAQTAQRRADDERRRADDERRRADDEQRRADDEQRRADDEAARAKVAEQRAEALAARLRALGIDPDA